MGRTVRWAMAGALAALLPGGPAQAMPIVEVRIDGAASPATVQAGESFTVEILVTGDEFGISSYGVSLVFDEEGQDAFDVVSVEELLPPGFTANLTSGVEAIEESGLGLPGAVLTCEAVTLGAGPVNASSSACRVRLVATGVTGSFAIDAGLFNPGIDGIFDNQGSDRSQSLQSIGATVHVVPEPGSSLLIAIGSLGLLRRRRSLT
jgi:hypothetical protein